MYRALFREATQSDKETEGFLATSPIFKGLLNAWLFRSRTWDTVLPVRVAFSVSKYRKIYSGVFHTLWKKKRNVINESCKPKRKRVRPSISICTEVTNISIIQSPSLEKSVLSLSSIVNSIIMTINLPNIFDCNCFLSEH